MQKILNNPEPFVDEMLDGILAAHADQLRRPSPRAIVRADAPIEGKVGIATGGGSGHLPVFMGYVGRGLIDGAAIGNVFASPSSDDMLDVTRAVSAGRGVLYLYGNYGGDRLNFDLAAELAADEGIEVRSVLGADDVASAPPERADSRRGIAGIVFLYKVAGAKAAEGASLDEVVATTERAAAGLRTMGVALSPCTIPAAGVPTFELPVGQMEIGMGIHGEPGIERKNIEPADRIVDDLLQKILNDNVDFTSSGDVAVMVNGLGGTPLMELYIAYAHVADVLKREGVNIYKMPYVGEYMTSLEMAGFSITLLKLDEDMKGYLEAPCDVAAGRPF